MIDRARVRECLTGPIASINTPFKKDGSLDFDGLRNAIDFNIEAGSKTVLLTAGDSHYIALEESEIAEVARVAVEHTAGRAMVVAAERYFNTRQVVEFARYVAELGADVLMVMPPDWGASMTVETLVDHYAAVAEIMPIMIVTNVFIPRGEKFGLDALKLALGRVDNIVAIKDDMLGTFARRMCLLSHDRWAVFSGGLKQNHLDVHPYGCDGYMSTFLKFKPEVAHQYWRAIEANDLHAAASVIHANDNPFMDLIFALPGGFDAGIHGVLELFGICERWRRPPYYSLSDKDMEQLAGGLRGIGVL